MPANLNPNAATCRRCTTSFFLDRQSKRQWEIELTEAFKLSLEKINHLDIAQLNRIGLKTYAKDKLSFPKLRDTKTFEAKLKDLVQRKDLLRDLNNKLKVAHDQQKLAMSQLPEHGRE